MKKYLYIFLAISLAVGLVSCSSDDDDEDYFKVKGATEEGSLSIKIDLENDITMTTLNIESNINDWKLVKKDTREDYWSFDNDLTKPNNTLEVKGNGNKAINIYLEQNPNKQERAANITVYYGDKSKKTISIIQKGTTEN